MFFLLYLVTSFLANFHLLLPFSGDPLLVSLNAANPLLVENEVTLGEVGEVIIPDELDYLNSANGPTFSIRFFLFLHFQQDNSFLTLAKLCFD